MTNNCNKTLSLGELNLDFLSQAAENFGLDAKNRLAQNAVTNSKWGDILINRNELTRLNPPSSNALAFSVKLTPEMKITSQKSSGRCWIFAALNWFRRDLVVKYNLTDAFELSQPYLFFYDKLEKCNYFLEQMLLSLEEPLEGRLVQHLLTDMTNDGGQWDMLVNLINKYGLVPKSVYSESEATQASFPMNKLLKSKLREFAQVLRAGHAGGKSQEALRQDKQDMMHVIYRILSIHLGTPPDKFDFCVHDKDKKYLSFPDLTPLQFAKDFLSVDVNDYVSVVNDPRNPYDRTMTVDKLGNVVGGKDVFYINADVSDLSSYAMAMLDKKMPVWFGCDVGKESSMRKNGIMSTDIFDYDLVFNTNTKGMSKMDRLKYHESEMTHAMLFTGYDLSKDGKVPSKWRVENSWGEDRSDKGYDVMTQDWFQEHMYQVVVPKNMLSAKHLALMDSKPIVLPVWDPMGSLANL